MKLGISQPTFLPWNGYISLINYVDELVILDDVQFEKRSWQQRNKIILNGKEFFLTVPVKTKSLFSQKINQVLIDNSKDYIRKHLLSIKHAYIKTKYFNNYYEEIVNIYIKNQHKLIDLNLSLIEFILLRLKINTKISFSSDLKIKSKKENLIKDICIKKGCKEYISTIGARDYLYNLSKQKLPFKIRYYEFNLSQKFNNIVNKQLSILDLLFNFGEDESIKIIKDSFQIIK